MSKKSLSSVFEENKDILTVFTTAGYPNLSDTPFILRELDKNGVDIIEVGLPYSDPLADGPTIQKTSEKALANGMNITLLFDQLESIKGELDAPILLMGYYNQVVTYGLEKFLSKCFSAGVQGLILPDMPFDIYLEKHKELFDKYNQKTVFLITPKTDEERLIQIDNATNGFIYIVSSSSTTGNNKSNFDEEFLNKIKNFQLKNPTQIGFGISTKNDFELANQYADGAIIGSAFLRAIENSNDLENDIKDFIKSIKG